MGQPNGKQTGCLIAIILLFCSAVGRAADSPAEKVLAKQGLKRVGSLYVLDAESDVKKKLEEVRQLSKQWNSARVQQAAVGTAKDHQELMQELNGQVTQIRSEIAAVNQQIARVPRFRGRFWSAYAQEQNAELNAYRNQLNLALNQQNAFLNQVRSRPPDPKLQQKLASDVESARDKYVQEARDLIKLVQSTKEKYSSLAHNDEVKKALNSIESGARAKPKLGPSHEFLALGKLVDKLEKELGEPPADVSPKASRKPRRAAR
jgi:signal transduction histidine kinase